jgi:hypothetical protein
MRSRGANCYLPIPFAKSLVVSCTAGDCYYAFDVMQWPAGTPVQAFAPAHLATLGAGRVLVDATTRIGPYDTELGRRRAGARCSRARRAQGSRRPAAGQPRRTRSRSCAHCLLVVRCGEEETVRVPLADFFAMGSLASPYCRPCLAVTADRAICAFPMPMPAGGSVEIVPENDYGAMVPQLNHVQSEALADRDPLLFRASYHIAKNMPTRPFGDHLVLDAKGVGRFVGCSLLVRNPSRVCGARATRSSRSTANCSRRGSAPAPRTTSATRGATRRRSRRRSMRRSSCQGPADFGITQLHRTHLLDSVPFQQSFRFDLERWHWVDRHRDRLRDGRLLVWRAGRIVGPAARAEGGERAIERPAPPPC